MVGYLKQNYTLIHAFPPRSRERRTSALDRIARRTFAMAPKLSQLFAAGDYTTLKGSLDRPFSGLAMDSRRVAPGSVFFALPGLRTDGAHFINEAIDRGAVAIVTQRIPVPSARTVTFIEVPDARVALARVARTYYQNPDQALSLVGVTGTNGKTTVSHLAKHLLEDEGRVGLLGTVSYDLGARTVPSFKTTPEAIDICGMLAQIRDAGCREVVMEISSHGIDQHRVRGLQLGVAVFTNLTQDHLDYHGSLEAYFEVKARLFTGETGTQPKIAVINVDDPYGRRLVERVRAMDQGPRLITFGEASDADLRADAVQLASGKTTFDLSWAGATVSLQTDLVGRYNMSNVLAAVGVAWALGRDPREATKRLATFPGVPGRMERIGPELPYQVFVDYAHTDDALRNAVGMLRAVTTGRLIVVFGCGGNRDRAKRPLMVAAVESAADLAVVTADNPRRETVESIFADMRPGVREPAKFMWIEDRRRAISLALDLARPGDSILVAGKGHESYQEFEDTVIPFDDRQVVRELIERKSLKPTNPTGFLS